MADHNGSIAPRPPATPVLTGNVVAAAATATAGTTAASRVITPSAGSVQALLALCNPPATSPFTALVPLTENPGSIHRVPSAAHVVLNDLFGPPPASSASTLPSTTTERDLATASGTSATRIAGTGAAGALNFPMGTSPANSAIPLLMAAPGPSTSTPHALSSSLIAYNNNTGPSASTSAAPTSSTRTGPSSPRTAPLSPTFMHNDALTQAAIAARLPVGNMTNAEYRVFGRHFGTPDALSTYLDVRNRILQAFYQSPTRTVSLNDALRAARTQRTDLATAVYQFLVRHGAINFGLVRPLPPTPVTAQSSTASARQRTFVVIGAGMAGLACARQLQHVFSASSAPLPKVIVLEARNRVGGRMYTHPLYTKTRSESRGTAHSTGVDLGAKIVTGWEGGNPIKTIVKHQLNLMAHDVTRATRLYDANGVPVPDERDVLCEAVFNEILEETVRMRASAEDSTGSMNDVERGEAGDEDDDADAETEDEFVPTTHLSKTMLTQSSYQRRSTRRAARAAGGQGRGTAASSPPRSLGEALERALAQHPRYQNLTDADLRLIHWHIANLEFANATTIDQLSLEHWDQDDEHEFFGPHSMVVGGYGQVPYALAYGAPSSSSSSSSSLCGGDESLVKDKLGIRLNAPVAAVEWKRTPRDNLRNGSAIGPNVIVRCRDGTEIDADAAIIAVPLGVLKAQAIKFQPELPKEKTEAIARLGFGVLNKVVLVFQEPFWDLAADSFGFLNPMDPATQSYVPTRGQSYLFWNMTPVVKLPVLVGMIAGDAAVRLEAEPDQVIVQDAIKILERVHGAPIPAPLETIVTRWSYDEFSRGSYSYVARTASGDDYDRLAAPVGNTLFFGGEHTCREYPATVHGAYLSGVHAAAQLGNVFLGNVKFVEDPECKKQAEQAAAAARATPSASNSKPSATVTDTPSTSAVPTVVSTAAPSPNASTSITSMVPSATRAVVSASSAVPSAPNAAPFIPYVTPSVPSAAPTALRAVSTASTAAPFSASVGPSIQSAMLPATSVPPSTTGAPPSETSAAHFATGAAPSAASAASFAAAVPHAPNAVPAQPLSFPVSEPATTSSPAIPAGPGTRFIGGISEATFHALDFLRSATPVEPDRAASSMSIDLDVDIHEAGRQPNGRKKKRSKRVERAISAKIWALKPVPADKWGAQDPAPSIPCTVASCKHVSATPSDFHQHLISHLPVDQRGHYVVPDAQGAYPGLPMELMPAQPPDWNRSPFLEYKVMYWAPYKASHLHLGWEHYQLQSGIATQWAELPTHIKEAFTAVVDHIRNEVNQLANDFVIQCKALGVPDYATTRTAEIHADWSAVTELLNPDGTPRSCEQVDEPAASALVPVAPPVILDSDPVETHVPPGPPQARAAPGPGATHGAPGPASVHGSFGLGKTHAELDMVGAHAATGPAETHATPNPAETRTASGLVETDAVNDLDEASGDLSGATETAGPPGPDLVDGDSPRLPTGRKKSRNSSSAGAATPKRSKFSVDAIPPELWALKPPTADEWHAAGRPGIPCTVASCTYVAPTPPEFHQHLVSHLPADRQQQYLTPDDQGVYCGLPTDLMPAPPRPVLRNTFVRYMTHHWPGLAAKYPYMPNIEIRSRLAQQWAELDEGIKTRYAAICDDIRKRFKRVTALFSLQCEALGVPHFMTPRQIEVPTDWSSVDKMTTPDGALRTAVDEGEETTTEPQTDASPAGALHADAPPANPSPSNPPPPAAELAAEDVGTPMDVDAIGDESARDAAQSILKRQWSFGVPESKRRKKEVDVPSTVIRALRPLTAEEWQQSGRPRIPCSVVQCEHLSTTPLYFFQHLVSHLPADEQERYTMANPDGTYPCLPLDVMPAPPRTRHHGTTSLYKALHWGGVKAKQPNASRTQLGELLTQQWNKLDPRLKAEYTAVDAQIRTQRSRLNAVFMLQCEALGIPDFTTSRQVDVPADWSAIAGRMNPDGTPRAGNQGETAAAVVPPLPPPPTMPIPIVAQPTPVKRRLKKSVPVVPLPKPPSSAATVPAPPQPVVPPPAKPKVQKGARSSGPTTPSDGAVSVARAAAPAARSAVLSSRPTNPALSTSSPASSSAPAASLSSGSFMTTPIVASSTSSTPPMVPSRATATKSPELPSMYPSTWSPSVAAAMAVINGPSAPYIRPQVIPSPSYRMLVSNRVAQALSPALPAMHAAAGSGPHPMQPSSSGPGPAPPTTALPGVALPFSMTPASLPTSFAAYQAQQIGDQIAPSENQSALQSYFNLMAKDSEFKEFREQQAQARAQREAGIVRAQHDMRVQQAIGSAALVDGPRVMPDVPPPSSPESRNGTSSEPAAAAPPNAPARDAGQPEEWLD
ncbi:hypothetical protein AMAG_13986 [Allomyces macrogynus ATCC 38327]|uniref:SWIRM domain-containing protein n=1 Tax=Allomyces macrogynus (strain ATCC 38327) TaxID=578462 RepID=A0A0L0T383_ALLM3|nr:hypothetical protein, variant [Allomyces macrogynus ATCC 38327]KNE69130.1 hypothetical protein AMAG_13986 [Allomyces macrogynus ATCC 38327]|eukprot:KNE69129.1 hypothetical protein, variant [Allomyces macrogynus ATCC 38327]